MGGIRIGAVSYLNTKPLVDGLAEVPGVELSFGVPSALSDRMAQGFLDVALLPVIELARFNDLEIVPGLGITTRGPSRSVLLVSRVPPERIETLALDPESRTSNALARVLLGEVWSNLPEIRPGRPGLEASLDGCDAAVRIGDKALFETIPPDLHVLDLGRAWTRATSLPFVFATWSARPGVVDRSLYRSLHDARRRGSKKIDVIASEFRWNGTAHPEIVTRYLREHIRFRLGSDEIRAMQMFFGYARNAGLIDREPPIHLALKRRTGCDEIAART